MLRTKRGFFSLSLLPAFLLLTGCPSNQYVVELTPKDASMERKLEFYCQDGSGTNGPNYCKFNADELGRICALYPSGSLERDGLRNSLTGTFRGSFPADVGGAGSYTNFKTSLGSVGFYLERFRGDDDLAGRAEKRLKAADQLTDYIIGWSRAEFRHERGYEKLHQFLNNDFRHDLKNLTMYGAMVNTSYVTRSSSPEEFAVRFGQYLSERGYLQMSDVPPLFHALMEEDARPFAKLGQRLIASKLNVPQNSQSVAFLADPVAFERSWTNYLAGTDAFATKLRHWQKEKALYELKVAEQRVRGLIQPAAQRKGLPQAPEMPSPYTVTEDIVGEMSDGFLTFASIFGENDHVTVCLALPHEPDHANGKWDAVRKQVIWESALERSSEDHSPPAFCYANWSEPDEAAQKEHFGTVLLKGDNLTEYCLWRAALSPKESNEWETFLATLQSSSGWKQKLSDFYFTTDPKPQPGKNPAQRKPLSTLPKKLLLPTDDSAK